MADPASFIASWLTPSSLFIFVNLVIGTIAITSRFTPKNHHHHHHHPHLAPSPSLLQRVSSFNLTHYYTHHHHPDPDFTHPQLVPTPSLLQRVKSFNLSFRKHEPTHAETHHLQPQHAQSTNPELVRTPSLLDRLTSFDLSLKNQEPTNAQTQHAQPEPEPEQPELVRSPSLLQRLQSINLSRLYRSEPVHGEDPSGGSGKAEMRKSASERRGSIEREEEEEVERRRPQTARVEATSCREDEEVDAKADDFINRFKKQLRLQRIDSLLRYRAGSG